MRFSLKNWIILLVLAKGVVWSALVPLWHFPDEQAHFAQVSYLGELGGYPPKILHRKPGGPEYGWDLSEEILIAEQRLGTQRDNGINKFTYHPEYRIPYTSSTIGLYEKEISSLPREIRTRYVKTEAANYPHGYYWSMALPYRLFYSSDLITRVFAARIGNLVYIILFTYFVWEIGLYVWPKHPFYQGAFALFTTFHPMYTFVASGVSSDNAINTWYAAFILLCLKILYRGISGSTVLLAVILLGIGPFIKQQSLLVYPVFLGVLMYVLWRTHSVIRKRALMYSGVGVSLLLGSVLLIRENNVLRAYLAFPLESYKVNLQGFLNFFLWTISHTVREVLPWYWGVFNWLGVALPRLTNRILIRVVGFAMLGFLILVIRKIRSRAFTRQDGGIVFLLGLSVWYFLGITLWDYVFFSQYNYSFGIQGRYFFPTIVGHMALLLYGIKGWFPRWFLSYYPHALFLSVVLMIVLNMQALSVVLSSYYDLTAWNVFFTQVSQYKPFVFKYPYILVWIILYAAVMVFTLFVLWREFRRAIEKKGSPVRQSVS